VLWGMRRRVGHAGEGGVMKPSFDADDESSALAPTNLRLTAAEVAQRLRARFKAPAYALFLEVNEGTGRNAGRRADALAMNLYPSAGLEIHGFEIKVARGDWLKEVEQPQKASRVARFCDRWWVVAGATDVVKEAELPATWGLLAPTATGLRAVRRAPRLKPQPVSRAFVASLARAMDTNSLLQQMVRQERDAGYKQGYARAQADFEHRKTTAHRDFERLQETVKRFEEASGVQVADGWSRPEGIGAAVKLVMLMNNGDVLRYAESALHLLEGSTKHVHEAIQHLKKSTPSQEVSLS